MPQSTTVTVHDRARAKLREMLDTQLVEATGHSHAVPAENRATMSTIYPDAAEEPSSPPPSRLPAHGAIVNSAPQSATEIGAHRSSSQPSAATLDLPARGRHREDAKPRGDDLRKPCARKEPPPKKETKHEPLESDIEEFSSPEVVPRRRPSSIPPLVESDEIETSPERDSVEGGSDADISEWSE